MPSNNELIDRANALAVELNVEKPDTKGLKNDGLTALVAELEAKLKEKAAVQPPAPDPNPPAVQPPAAGGEKKAKLPPFTVADGKSITSSRGVLGPGAEVREKDLTHAALENLVAKGYIVKNG